MDLTLLETTLRARGEPAYRTRQVWDWAARGAAGYGAMSNLPGALREDLAAAVPFSTLTLETQRESTTNGLHRRPHILFAGYKIPTRREEI